MKVYARVCDTFVVIDEDDDPGKEPSTGNGDCGISRDASPLLDLATCMRFIPHFTDGRPEGFKVFSIRPDSMCSLIGLKNGDTVRSINGIALDSPDGVFDAYATIKRVGKARVEVDRSGQRVTRLYTVDPRWLRFRRP